MKKNDTKNAVKQLYVKSAYSFTSVVLLFKINNNTSCPPYQPLDNNVTVAELIVVFISTVEVLFLCVCLSFGWFNQVRREPQRGLGTVADPGFAKGGADHGERAEREPTRGSGGGAPSAVQGQSPGGGSGGLSPGGGSGERS